MSINREYRNFLNTLHYRDDQKTLKQSATNCQTILDFITRGADPTITSGDYRSGLDYIARFGNTSHIENLKRLVPNVAQREFLIAKNSLGHKPMDEVGYTENLSQALLEGVLDFAEPLSEEAESSSASSSYTTIGRAVSGSSKGKEAMDETQSMEFRTVEKGFTQEHRENRGNQWITPAVSGPSFKEKPRWQLRVAIFPTRDNILKAMAAINSVIGELKNIPELKIFMPPENQHLTQWDATLGVPESDRDQRGKELCFSLEYDEDAKRYPMTPKEYKDFMLRVWSAFDAYGVDTGYTTSYGEREIPATLGIMSPFCYATDKDFTKPHALLHAENYNELGLPDPFEGVVFTETDMTRYGIRSFSAATQSAERVNYYANHLPIAEAKLISDFNRLINNSPTMDVEKILKDACELSDEELAKFFQANGKFDSIKPYLPGRSDSKLSPLYNPHIAAYPPKKQRELLQELYTNYKKEVKRNFEDITANGNDSFLKFLTTNVPCSDSDVRRVMSNLPHEMQEFYRRYVHIQHERMALAREQKRNIGRFPEEFYEDFLAKAKSSINSSTWDMGLFNKSESLVADLKKILNEESHGLEGHKAKYFKVVVLLHQLRIQSENLNHVQIEQLQALSEEAMSVKDATKRRFNPTETQSSVQDEKSRKDFEGVHRLALGNPGSLQSYSEASSSSTVPVSNSVIHGLLSSVKSQMQKEEGSRKEGWQMLYENLKALTQEAYSKGHGTQTDLLVLHAAKSLLENAAKNERFNVHKQESGNARQTFLGGLSHIAGVASSSAQKSLQYHSKTKPQQLIDDYIGVCDAEIKRLQPSSPGVIKGNR